jgi:protein-S-isoprenylcysteine O-methyltransferase Ste14
MGWLFRATWTFDHTYSIQEGNMGQRSRTNLAAGLLLILVGAIFLAIQIAPGLFTWFQPELNWPLFVVGAGFVLLVIGLLAGEPGMAVPASIVGGIGGLLYWQNLTGRWDTWSYAWTLIPGFVGLGVILSGILSGQTAQSLRDGGRTVLVSLVLFAVFGTLMGANFTGVVWPSLLIAAGVLLLIGNLLRRR